MEHIASNELPVNTAKTSKSSQTTELDQVKDVSQNIQ